MVSDSELVNRLREILRSSDLETTTAGTVRRQLEKDFGVDLSDRKKFITQLIDEILQGGDINGGHDENVKQEEGEDGESGEDEDDDGDCGGRQKDEHEQREDEEEEDEDEEGSDDKASNKRPNDEETKKTKRGTGFTRLCSISPQLQEFVGVSEIARTEVVKKLWAYIRENNLQDPSNKRKINCDDKLRSIFRVDTIDMFQMNKALSKHIWPLEAGEDHSINSSPQEKKQKRQKEEDVEKSKKKAKKNKGGTTGFLKPLQLSEAFVKFLGTGETTLSRADSVKRIWDYIKQNDLQDPSDKRRIICDEKLKELFEVDSFNGFSVTKFLTAHLTKTDQ